MPKGLAALQDPGQGVHTGRGPDGIIQDINRHAAVVMEGRPDDQGQQHTAEDVAQAVRLARQVLNSSLAARIWLCLHPLAASPPAVRWHVYMLAHPCLHHLLCLTCLS